MRGRLITFEGGEGAGKSTQIRLLAARLRQHLGCDLVVTREPGGTPFAERLRQFLLTTSDAAPTARAEALLFNAARADHIERCIRPALARGAWVLSDRFMDSTRAYQGAAGAVPEAEIVALERLVVGADRPDLTLILDLDPAIGLARAKARAAEGDAQASPADTFEGRALAFHRALRDAFRHIAASEPRRCLLLDATEAAEVTADRIWQVVRERLLEESA